MPSKARSAIDILRNEGLVSLSQEMYDHFTKALLSMASQTTVGRRYLYRRSFEEIRNRMYKESDDLDDILNTVLDIQPGYPPYQLKTAQLRDEIKALATLVEDEKPRNVLEIGTYKGGSFYIWSRYLDSVENIISLDLPGGKFGGGYDEDMEEIFREFAPDKEMDFVRGNSHKSSTYDEVTKCIEEEIDFLFIDGDHTYDGVKKDFEMYSQLVADGGIIALHDIVTHPNDEETVRDRSQDVNGLEERHLSWGDDYPSCNVDEFWEELVEEYDTEEIISHPKQTWGGIGVVRI